ncbi:glycosyltransferase family 4 protein [Desulfobacterota bacterium AH_259_B03_O07]|nr:glycosyltransferase family 4 protein [Desulfobacterota bacterium AH_259_B03_O07]
MLNVLHISSPNDGGSGQSAYKVHKGLNRLGVRSRMLIGSKVPESESVRGFWNVSKWWVLDRVCGKITAHLSLQNLFYPSSFLLVRDPWFREADVVQLYNIHSYFSHPALVLLSRLRPVVWRLSDMWPLTGGCSYSYDCERWKSGCGSCPLWIGKNNGAPRFSEYVDLPRDSTALLWRIKKWVYKHSRLNIVVPSEWLSTLVKESPLLSRFTIKVIPNGVDTKVFRPIPKTAAREVLGIDPTRRVILFSAHVIDSPRKGSALLNEALEQLVQASTFKITLLIVGQNAEKLSNFKFPTTCLGFVKNEPMMAAIYSAADLFVLPTLADNLPNSILESMSCGTPVVSFNVGGIPEIVRHMETGYLAAYKNSRDLARGIQVILENPDLHSRLSARCREVVKKEYTLELQARQFYELYMQLTQADTAQ